MARPWVKIWCKEWLDGSMADEALNVRGAFATLLVLAGSEAHGASGTIKISEKVGLPDAIFAQLMRCSVRHWRELKYHLMDTGRIAVAEHNIIIINNWSRYQSEYQRTKEAPSRVKSTPKSTPKGTTKSTPKSTHGDIERDREKERECPNSEKPKTQEKRKFSEASDEYHLSSLLFNLIQKNDSKAKEPNLQEWAKHIDWLVRIDKRSPMEIALVIKWTQQHPFWHRNILSTEKLRKHFPRLLLDMGAQAKEGEKPSVLCRRCGKEPKWQGDLCHICWNQIREADE